ncbi:MAG: type II toxin-antitoxin system RelE/ParE family toxin [Gammaproteobacteria bacterium]|nr:type II toxin-antitoxin system RelE/ParE family toxin [Gammaproteobacteria bacterium]
MSFSVALTQAARDDLEELCRPMIEADTPDRCEQIADKLAEQFSRLAESPERGTLIRELKLLGIKEYREVYLKPHRIIYRVIHGVVYVYCIVDSRQDMQSVLLQRLVR